MSASGEKLSHVIAKRGHETENVGTRKDKIIDRHSIIGTIEEFDRKSISSEQKKPNIDKDDHLPLKSTWSLKSWKSCSLVRKKDKNHTKTILEKTNKVDKEQSVSTSDMIDKLKNDKIDREVALEKRSYVLDELVKTEKDYVRDLSLVVKDYIEVIRNPSAAECDIPIPKNLKMIVTQRIIFGNIEEIYLWHKNVFLEEIENCSAQPLKISNVFKKNESKFYMYIDYCQKSQIFDCFMNEYRLFFEEMRKFSCHRFPLRDFLIRPVKRIMTYTLLLREMLKYSIQANLEDQLDEIQQAIDIMNRLTKNVDEMMIVDRLRDFSGSITSQGKLIMHGSLRCAMNPTRINSNKDAYNDFQVFLFERSMIFAVESDKKRTFTDLCYVYKTQITLNNMVLKEKHDWSGGNASNDSSNGPFLVNSVDPSTPKMLVVCQAYSDESRCEWLKNLRELLKAQRDFQAALQMPTISIQNNKQCIGSRVITSYRQ